MQVPHCRFQDFLYDDVGNVNLKKMVAAMLHTKITSD